MWNKKQHDKKSAQHHILGKWYARAQIKSNLKGRLGNE